MKYIINHVPISNKKRTRRKMVPEYITIHSTGNPNANARSERAYLTNPQNKSVTSYHIVIDDKEAIEVTPLDEVAYHAGDGYHGTGNSKSIGIEISEYGNRQKAIENAISLVAEMLHQRGWNVDRLRRHYDWSGKNCPRIMSANNWAGWKKFVEDVRKEVEQLKIVKVTQKIIDEQGQIQHVEGYNINGQTHFHIREIAKLLGKETIWNPNTREISFK